MGRGSRQNLASVGPRAANPGRRPQLSEEIKERYNYGQCLALALVLQERFGGELVGLGLDNGEADQIYQNSDRDPLDEWENKPSFEHFGLRLPDGRVVDVQGTYASTDQFADLHGYLGLIEGVSQAEAETQTEGLAVQDLDQARHDSQSIIDAYGL